MADMSLAFKVCTTCSKSHPATNEFFGKSKTGLHGVISTCKTCASAKTAQWRMDNPGRAAETMRKARLANPEKFRLYEAAQALKHKDKKIASAAGWRKRNPERAKQSIANWIEANLARYKLGRATYRQKHAEKIKANFAIWYAANRESEIASAAARRAANPDKDRENARKWYAENKEQGRASRSAWSAANPGKKRIYSENRRARKLGSGETLSIGLAEKLLQQQDGKCACCGEALTDYHLDHRMPLALGGAHSDENMQLLTPLCNMRKGAKHPDDYVKYLQTINR